MLSGPLARPGRLRAAPGLSPPRRGSGPNTHPRSHFTRRPWVARKANRALQERGGGGYLCPCGSPRDQGEKALPKSDGMLC